MPGPCPDSGPERHSDAKVAELAARQHAVFTLPQLAVLGLSGQAVYRRAGRRRLHRIHPGVYSLVPPELLTRDGLFMAAVLAFGPNAVLSHRSAAVLHGLVRNAPDIHVTAPGHRRARGVRGHRSLTLTPRDATTVNGIPCTSLARTLLDLGDELTAPNPNTP